MIIRTFLLYLAVNIIVYPGYLILSILGYFGLAISETVIEVQDLLLFYAIALIPSFLLAIATQLWGDRWKLNKKLSILFLIITAIILYQFIVLNPFQFGEVWNLG